MISNSAEPVLMIIGVTEEQFPMAYAEAMQEKRKQTKTAERMVVGLNSEWERMVHVRNRCRHLWDRLNC